ncbi:MAG TPA: glycosyltransferase [Trichocoleus sp.]
MWSTPLNQFFAPKVEPIELEYEYDLLYVVLTEPWEIFNLRAIPNWREKCRYAVCHFVELWQKEVEDLELLRKEYEQFDKIYSNTFFTTEEISAATGCACEYLPFTVDAIEFCPYPNPPERFIDVSYIGRRSLVTHQALLNLAENEPFFYLYDTAKNFRTNNHREHRKLLAKQLKRTRYFFANRSKLDDPSSQNRQPEFGWRFFEGMAAGTVVLGTIPDTEVFKRCFNWQDAAINLPFDVNNIADVIAELDSQPERLARIRHDNIVNALQRYDWLYVWQAILKDAGMTTTPSMQHRAEKLQELVALAEADFAKVELRSQALTVKQLVL